MKKELWIQNTTPFDVMLSDLGLKVPAEKSLNIYKSNPHLTEDRVKLSMDSGSLNKRISSNTLKIIKGPTTTNTAVINDVKALPMTNAVKTRSSVVIDNNAVNIDENGSFEFADYGVEEMPAVIRDQNSVMVKQKQDGADELPAAVDPILSNQAFDLEHPTNDTNTSTPYAVYGKKPSRIVIDKGVVLVDGKVANARNLGVEGTLSTIAEKAGIEKDQLPQDVIDTVEADIAVIKDSATAKTRPIDSDDFGVQVASKSKKGTVIMKVDPEKV